MSKQIHIPNVKSKSQKMGEKSPENNFLQRTINQLKGEAYQE